VKLRREARLLLDKALASMRRAAEVFNSFEEQGRVSAVLLHTQHAFEMLLKAGLVQRGVRVFDPRSGRSLGFDKCTNLAMEYLKLSEDDAGTLRTIDALRDDEQHWLTACSEGLLYAHVRAAVTLFDDLLQRLFKDRLTSHWPPRVLPVSTEPPRDIQLLIDEEYSQVMKLLKPGGRKRPEAQAKIRALLALESHMSEDAHVSKHDVDRVEAAVKKGSDRSQVFPRLSGLRTDVGGEGLTVTVRFTKSEGVPVHFVEDAEAGGIREVDLQKKFHWTGEALAKKLDLSSARLVALRRWLGIDGDESCRHVFKFGSVTHPRYSDNAYRCMRDALDGHVDMNEVWRTCRPSGPWRPGDPSPGATEISGA
jgi:hypothetical protein